jgi:hypothetical protein
MEETCLFVVGIDLKACTVWIEEVCLRHVRVSFFLPLAKGTPNKESNMKRAAESDTKCTQQMNAACGQCGNAVVR